MADPYVPFGFRPPTLGPPRQQPQAPPDLQSILDIMGGQPLSMGAQPTEEEALGLQQEAQGLGNLGAMAIPFAMGGPMAIGARGLASLARMFPMTTTAAAGGGALVGESTAAGPQQQPTKPQSKGPNAAAKPTPKPKTEPQSGADPALQRLLDSDALLRGLQKQIDDQNAIANAPAGNDPAAGTYPKSSRDGARARAADLQKEYNARLMELSRANLPFDQAYPWLAQNRALLAFGAPAAAGYATRSAAALADRAKTIPWKRALNKADDALARGNDRQHQHYMDRAARWEPQQGGSHFWGETGLPAIAGAGIGAEMALLPYQHNITNAPEGSPQRREAENVMGDWRQTLFRGGYGGGIGAVGGIGGAHLPNIPFGFRPPPMSGTQLPPAPAGSTGAPTAPAQSLGPVRTPTASPQLPAQPAPQAPPSTTPLPGGMWPPPPSVPSHQPPGLATLGNQRPAQPAASDNPPVPRSARPRHPRGTRDADGNPIGGRWVGEE